MADMGSAGDNGAIPGRYSLFGRGTLCSHRVFLQSIKVLLIWPELRACSHGFSSAL